MEFLLVAALELGDAVGALSARGVTQMGGPIAQEVTAKGWPRTGKLQGHEEARGERCVSSRVNSTSGRCLPTIPRVAMKGEKVRGDQHPSQKKLA